MKTMRKRIAFWIIGGIVGGAALLGLYIFGVQALWNWLVPAIFKGPVITYWQTAGLMLLYCMFSWLGGNGGWGRGHKKHNHWKNKWNRKWESMSDEDKAKWREHMHCCW